MKNFSLGLVFGATAGLVLSCFKDKNGQRLGQPLKKGYKEGIDEAKNFNESLNKAKDASKRLSENLPAAQKALNDISDDVQKYQNHTQRDFEEIKHQTDKIQNKFTDLDKEDKKN